MNGGRVVWKIGGSVLTSFKSFDVVAERICDFLAGDDPPERLYVVVSAMNGLTDKLVDRAFPDEQMRMVLSRCLYGTEVESRLMKLIDKPQTASFMLQGEIDSALRLGRALAERGLQAATVTQGEHYPVIAEGGHLNGCFLPEESSRRFADFEARYKDRRIVILSGFGAVNREGKPVLLGRNSTDYVAGIISALDGNVREVVFFKDTGGVYEHFGTAGQKLVATITSSQLRQLEIGDLLDRRTLDVIRCDLRIVDLRMRQGTLVINGSLAFKR